ncbi:uncharacterized protein PADG_07507 [Paracoccidioides brasiliensis Pb18]|uniref:AMP-dependent synthetase/ligase domain-containing protein n=1 Tax=Paracoccidioides brasiliensis (strain Pb18) TaxID=502780 RepID=C1GJS1_PARBD|nr:uncharacterized protein PADG_07507 [Paracoccidioides brasiliensis Pb18]EEH42687.1 hypothetical protein PADG_07507 [Paracoccidioides brasiliensis Pb18]
MVLTTLSPCLFPVNEHHCPPKIGHNFFKASDNTSDGTTSRADSFCVEHSISPLTFYKVLWALLLRKFTNANEVFFGVVEMGAVADSVVITSDPTGDVQTYPSLQSWCHVCLAETDSILDTMKQLESDPRKGCPPPELEHSPGRFNTELHLVTEDISNYVTDKSNLICPYMIDLQLCVSSEAIAFRFRASSMTGAVAQGLRETLKRAIKGVLDDPRQTVRKLDMLSNYDRTRIERWNKTDPWQQVICMCIQDPIHLQALSQPKGLAYDGWDGPLTFRELWEYSTRFSYYIYDLRVKKRQLVFLSMDMSKWAIIAMLSVLRAGAVCIPIDILNQTHYFSSIQNVRLALTDPSMSDLFAGHVRFVMTELPKLISELPPAPESYDPHVDPSWPAMIMFTSGVTSPPKPVVLDHGSISTNIVNLGETLEINDQSRIFQCSSLSSHVSIADILCTLVNGGCVCCPTECNREVDLSHAVSTARATHIFPTPTILRELTAEVVPTLKVISVIKDGLTIRDVEKWQDHVSLFYLYGSTESTLCCTLTDASHQERLKYLGRLNIGRALTCRTWIAEPGNACGALVPIGSIGELVVEGGILGRYYVPEENPEPMEEYRRNWEKDVTENTNEHGNEDETENKEENEREEEPGWEGKGKEKEDGDNTKKERENEETGDTENRNEQKKGNVTVKEDEGKGINENQSGKKKEDKSGKEKEKEVGENPFFADPEWLAKFPKLRPSQQPVGMFRTGDLVRYEHDGSIKFVGRMKI